MFNKLTAPQTKCDLLIDRCIKCLALVEIIDSYDTPYKHEILTVKQMLCPIISALRKQTKAIYPSALNNNIIPLKDSSAAASNVTNVVSLDPLNHSSLDVNDFQNGKAIFSDIIGCDRAKQSLEENIILQLKLPQEQKDKLFQGQL